MSDATSATAETPARSDGTVTATAAVLREVGEPLQLEEVELSAPGEGEILVRMRGVGVCHTDISGMRARGWSRRSARASTHSRSATTSR